MKPKLKPGDRVRRINCTNDIDGFCVQVGDVGTVIRYNGIGYNVVVKWDRDIHGWANAGNDPQNLQLVEESKLDKSEFTVKDSGARVEFSSGMMRDTATGKTDWELIFNGPMAERWAVHLTKGNIKYPDPEPGKANWMRASGQEELARFRKSAVRHFLQWLRGDVDEDHAAAVLFNINGAEYVKGKLSGGTTQVPDVQGTN